MLELKDLNYLIASTDAIYERLIEAGLKRKFISSDSRLRCIGKTTALIRFARKYGFGVIVPNFHKELREKYDYEHIYPNNYNARGLDMSFVFDEGVNLAKIDSSVDLVTGFVYE